MKRTSMKSVNLIQSIYLKSIHVEVILDSFFFKAKNKQTHNFAATQIVHPNKEK